MRNIKTGMENSNMSFDNVDNFFIELQSQNVSLLQLRLDKKYAVAELHSKFSLLTEKEKIEWGRKMVEVSSKILKKEIDRKSKELLSDFRNELRIYLPTPTPLKYNYPHIFRTANGFQFFVDTLYYFNVIDEYNVEKRGLQAVCDAIISNENYIREIIKPKIGYTEYIVFLRKCFNAKIKSDDKLTKGTKHKHDLRTYFNQNFSSINLD